MRTALIAAALAALISLPLQAHAFCEGEAHDAYMLASERNMGDPPDPAIERQMQFKNLVPASYMQARLREIRWIWAHPQVTPGEIADLAQRACIPAPFGTPAPWGRLD